MTSEQRMQSLIQKSKEQLASMEQSKIGLCKELAALKRIRNAMRKVNEAMRTIKNTKA
jgi:hypothetical protein